MMVDLAPASAHATATVQQTYRDYLGLLMFDQYNAIDALANGGLVLLPSDVERFNVRPRLGGPLPIGEKDLVNQTRYISARRRQSAACSRSRHA
jgi:hypothetical protein